MQRPNNGKGGLPNPDPVTVARKKSKSKGLIHSTLNAQNAMNVHYIDQKAPSHDLIRWSMRTTLGSPKRRFSSMVMSNLTFTSNAV